MQAEDTQEIHACGDAHSYKAQAVIARQIDACEVCDAPLALSISEEQAPGADHLGVVQDLGQSESSGTCQLHSFGHSGQALQQLL